MNNQLIGQENQQSNVFDLSSEKSTREFNCVQNCLRDAQANRATEQANRLTYAQATDALIEVPYFPHGMEGWNLPKILAALENIQQKCVYKYKK